MSYEVESPSETAATVTIRLSKGELQRERTAELQKLAQRVRIPGFRPGKVPARILEKKYGEALDADVRSKLVEREYQQAVRAKDLHPLRAPQLDEKDFLEVEGGDLEVKLELELVPRFELGNYRGLDVTAPEVQVEDADLDRQIEMLLRQHASSAEVGGPAESGDFLRVNAAYLFLDGSQYIPDEPVIVETGQGHLGEYPCPEVKETFLGAAAGDERKLSFVIPDQFPAEEHRGKTATVQCTVSAVLRDEVPELTEEFIKQLGHEGGVEAFRDSVRERMTEHLSQQRDRHIEELCVERLLAQHPFPLPDAWLKSLQAGERDRMRANLRAGGMEDGQIETHLLEVEGRMSEEVERRAREEILLDRIVEAEDLRVTEEELSHAVVEMAMRSGMEPQAFFDRLVESGQVPALGQSLKRGKARRFLRESIGGSDEKEQAGDSGAASAGGASEARADDRGEESQAAADGDSQEPRGEPSPSAEQENS